MASSTRNKGLGKSTPTFFFLLVLLEVGFLTRIVQSCILREREALMAFKQGVEDPFSRLRSWTANGNCCSWEGITCDNQTGQVMKLDLRNNNKTTSWRGEIDHCLCNLKHMQYLDLSANIFNVTIPKFLDCFQELRYLNLSGGYFHGAIPSQLGNLSKLHTLDLSGNDGLVLYEATWLGYLSSLQHFDFSHVNLENSTNWIQSLNKLPSMSVILSKSCSIRSLPQSLPLVNFTSLVTLDLSGNCLEAELPGWLFMIRNIENLFLRYIICDEEGHVIPFAVGNLKKLKALDLSHNKYKGSIPQSIGALSSLELLYFHGNELSGSISDNFFGKLSSLKTVFLQSNKFSGTIPTSLGMLPSLQELDISKNNFSGSIPTSLGKSSSLRSLSLVRNNFSGSISDNDYFGEMKSLTELDISENFLTGSLPTSLWKLLALRRLSLGSNNFIGMIPASLGNLQLLEYLDLSSNYFSGTIPDSLGNLQLLRDLDLSSNNLSGPIPTSIGKLRSLEKLDICKNKLEGNIPESVCELSSLGEFYLFGNDKMNGTLPHCIGQLGELWDLVIGGENFEISINESHFVNMTNLLILDIESVKSLVVNFSSDWIPPFRLQSLYIYSTRIGIGSEFPTWIRTQNTLNFLVLRNTSIYGSLPTWIWDFSDMEYMDLSNNIMTGELPYPKYRKSFIYHINLSSNKFKGSTWLNTVSEMMPWLEELSLSQNDFSGNIPMSLCKLVGLSVLDLSENNFSGEIPNCLMNVRDILKLANNNFHGKLPSLVGKKCQMQSLHLANNELSGTLPSSWKNCTYMEFLDLGRNKLSGDIPIWLTEGMLSLKVLRLRENKFSENVPQELSKLSSLQLLDLAKNNFSGIIPRTFGNFTAMKSNPVNELFQSPTFYSYPEHISVFMKGREMTYEDKTLGLVRNIDLSYNNLSGEIPRELGDLIYLKTLNLSHNYLTSSIPSTLDKLRELETLDLSRNHLSGEIPQQITTLDSLNSVNFSYNNLSGRIPTSNHFGTIITNLTFLGNPNLCGPPSSTTCGKDQPSMTNDMGDEESHDDRELLWVCFSIVFGFVIGFWIFYGILIFSQA